MAEDGRDATTEDGRGATTEDGRGATTEDGRGAPAEGVASDAVSVDELAAGVPSESFASERDEATICYPLRGSLPLEPADELLLIRKRRGLGADLYNGPGGKVEPGETPVESAVRETQEEVGVDVGPPAAVDKRGEFDFYFGDEHVFFCHVYVATDVTGSARESEEAIPEWRPREAIPYEEMWEDDVLWLPAVLDGETVRGVFYFDADGDELLEHALRTGVDVAD
jgi:8-oxo-dGTP diphosphatase